MSTEPWLPKLEYYENYGRSWNDYESALYAIFKTDFIDSQPFFHGKPVHIRKHPIEYGKEEAFFHVTCQDYQKNHDRSPDLRRCERIRWIKAFIEHYADCDTMKIWDEPIRSKVRTHLLLEEERYIVVLEKRANYYLLVTAFYLEHEHTLRNKLQHYKQYHSRKQ